MIVGIATEVLVVSIEGSHLHIQNFKLSGPQNIQTLRLLADMQQTLIQSQQG